MVRSCLAVSMCLLAGGLVRGDDEPEKPQEKMPGIVRPFPGDGAEPDGRMSESDSLAAYEKYRVDLIEKATQMLLTDQDVQRWIREYWEHARAEYRREGLRLLEPTSPEHGITGRAFIASRGELKDGTGDDAAAVNFEFSVPVESHFQYVVGCAFFTYYAEEKGILKLSVDFRSICRIVAQHGPNGRPQSATWPLKPMRNAQTPLEFTIVVFVYDSLADQTIVLDACEGTLPPGDPDEASQDKSTD